MTMEQLAIYLWREMPLTGWGQMLAAISVFVGVSIYLQGKWIMQETSGKWKSFSKTTDGGVIETVNCSVSDGHHHGVKTARLGLSMSFFSLVAFVGLASLQ